MLYLIQENCFREANYDYLVESLQRLGLEYVQVKVLPFVDSFRCMDDPDKEYVTDRKDIFPFGSIKLARIGKDQGWEPGSIITENHDFQVYREHYRENLLNWDSKVVNFTDSWVWDEEMYFVRPCKDTKAFTGSVFTKAEWEEFVHRSLTNGHLASTDNNTLMSEVLRKTEIQVSSVKDIQREYRFWVIGGKVVTGSMYRLGGRFHVSDQVDPDAVSFAESMVKLWQLDKRGFILDVCLADGQWKIVECGCLNCAGFYAANLPKVLAALEDLFNPVNKCDVCAYNKSYVTGDDEYPARTCISYCAKGHWENVQAGEPGTEPDPFANCADYTPFYK